MALPFAAMVRAMLPAVLDQTILATALPTIIAGELGSVTDVSWVVTAYVVAAAATARSCGASSATATAASSCWRSALVVFVVLASALCGAARDVAGLIVLRLVQGAAAGGLMTLAMAAVGDLVSPRGARPLPDTSPRRSPWRPSSGRCSAGWWTREGWRWVFLVNLPLGAAALAGLALRLPARSAERPEQPLDTLGAVLLAAATSALMLTCISGGDRYAWDSAEILALIGATAVLSGGLVAR